VISKYITIDFWSWFVVKILRLVKSWFFATKNGLIEPLQYAYQHRRLILMLARRDIAGRTSGTMLGAGWLLLQPALQLIGFWFLLDVVIKVRLTGGLSFLEYFLIGMLHWFFIAEVLQRSLGVYHEYSSIFQKMPFPLAILPIITVLMSAIIFAIINAGAALILVGVSGVPIAILNIFILAFWLIPFCYLLGIVGIFLKDIAQFFPFLISFIMYLTPIMYQPEMLPQSMKWILDFNPFSDLMILIHAGLQGLQWDSLNIIKPLIIWLFLLGPAWALFRRSEPHIREML
jgi:lipopolysaccharide transport system permease protein